MVILALHLAALQQAEVVFACILKSHMSPGNAGMSLESLVVNDFNILGFIEEVSWLHILPYSAIKTGICRLV